jgi:uncharacterized protein (DUF488 family)
VEKIPIYTIGYYKRSIEEFINLLKKEHIQYLVDIRSRPYSKFNSNFSKDELENLLRQQGIKYMFMGDLLGEQPNDSTCYKDGRVEYAKVREKDFFKEGISRIRTAWDKQLCIALMCLEPKPEECHRSKLIGSILMEQHIAVVHIDELGNRKTQNEVIQRIIGNPYLP